MGGGGLTATHLEGLSTCRDPGDLLGKFHGRRSLVGYSPWGCKSQTRLSD